MNSYVAPGQIQITSLEALNNGWFEEFLQNGFLIQSPKSQKVYLGFGLKKFEHGCFMVDSFYHAKAYNLAPKVLIECNIEQLINLIEENVSDFTIEELKNQDNDFMEDFNRIQKLFQEDTELEKLVSVTRADYKINENGHPIKRLTKLSQLEGSLYGHWRDGKGVLGVSPEPLFYHEGDSFIVRSLAGTIGTDVPDYANKLLSDPKEIYEHKLVIDDICAKLGDRVFDLKLEETIVRSFGKMAHLQTDIHFKSHDLSGADLISILSPTAALGGFPKKLADQYLRQLSYYNYEKEYRYFGGVLGFITKDISFALVGIRNIFWDTTKQQAEIHSGCGIVRQSIAENELKEIQRKRNSIASYFL